MEKEKLQKLTKQFTKGSQQAFNNLYEKFRKAVRGYILSHCFGQLQQKADDIEQDTWHTIWQKRDQFDTSRSFYTFVCYWANIMIKRRYCELTSDISLDDENAAPEIPVQDPVFAAPELSAEMENLISLTFTSGGPPHQLIVFGLNKLLTQWKPRHIVEELAQLNLEETMHILIKDYVAASTIPENMIYSLFWPLRRKMSQLVEEILEDEVSKTTYQPLLRMKVGETKLQDYFGTDPVHSISDWCYKVRNRVARQYKKKFYQTREKTTTESVSKA